MTAVITLDAGEAVVEDAAIKIRTDDLVHKSMEEAVLGGEPLVIDLIFLPASSPLPEVSRLYLDRGKGVFKTASHAKEVLINLLIKQEEP